MSANPSTPDAGVTYDLIARLATELAHGLGAEYMPHKLHEPDPRYAMLDEARSLLTRNARHVPIAVDEILELALSQGGYAPRAP